MVSAIQRIVQQIQINKSMTNTSNKTTIGGAISAVLVAVTPIVQNGDFEIKRDAGTLIIAVALAVLGYLAKDYNTTGVPTADTTPDTEKKS